MFNAEKQKHTKKQHKFDKILINFAGIVSIIYTIFLIVELYVSLGKINIIIWIVVDTFVCAVFLYEFFYLRKQPPVIDWWHSGLGSEAC